MTGEIIAALLGAGLAGLGGGFVLLLSKISKLEDKLSGRVGELHDKVDQLRTDTMRDHAVVIERLARVEEKLE